MQTTDIQVINAFKSNDNYVIQRFYKESFPLVKSFVVKNFSVLDHEELKDVYQESVISMWTNIREDKFVLTGEAKLSTYLLQVCRFKILDKLKKKSYKIEKSFDQMPEQIEGLTYQEEEDVNINKLRSLLDKMPDRCRSILTLFYFYDKKLDEIAVQLEISNVSIKNEKYRCMQKLRNYFEQ